MAFWLLYLLDYHLSVAVGVGFIALAGVAVEIGVVKLVYLKQALASETLKARKEQAPASDTRTLLQAVINGALLRVRPITMTVAAIIAGLLPIMLGSGTGSEVMRRIAAPMVGRHGQRDAADAGGDSRHLPVVAKAQIAQERCFCHGRRTAGGRVNGNRLIVGNCSDR